MNNKNTFNYDANPTNENITYVFERLITPIAVATNFTPYKKSWEQFENILKTVAKWMITYDTTKDLLQINFEEFIKVRQQLFDLDSKYLPEDGFYAEDAYEWILQLQILIEKLKKGDSNGI